MRKPVARPLAQALEPKSSDAPPSRRFPETGESWSITVRAPQRRSAAQLLRNLGSDGSGSSRS